MSVTNNTRSSAIAELQRDVL